MRNVTPEQVAMAEQHRRGELPDRIEGLSASWPAQRRRA
jgi:hypothetical protein